MAKSNSTAPAEDIVELVGVRRTFREIVAVENLSLRLKRGEFFSLLGPSGCGKTTTLRMIAGFERPDQGEIRIAGRNVADDPPDKRPVNTVFQSYALFSHLNIFENVAFGLREQRRPRAEIERRVRAALELVQLSGLELRRPRQLSGGQQQRVALARAIVMQPTVLLLDEPLGALDLKLRKAMQLELKRLQQQLGITFLYVTHDQEEALLMSDRLAVMRRGRIEQLGTPEEIYNRPVTRYVADFVGEANVLEGKVVDDSADRVALEIGQSQQIYGQATLPVRRAAAACLVIRPERIDVTAQAGAASRVPAGHSHLTGTVGEAFFVGVHRRYQVQLDDGQKLVAARPSRTTLEPIAVGDRVSVSWAPEDACVFVEAAE